MLIFKHHIALVTMINFIDFFCVTPVILDSCCYFNYNVMDIRLIFFVEE